MDICSRQAKHVADESSLVTTTFPRMTTPLQPQGYRFFLCMLLLTIDPFELIRPRIDALPVASFSCSCVEASCVPSSA